MNNIRSKKIGIIGSGSIGISLAAMFTGNGYETTVLTLGPKFTEQAKECYSNIYSVLIKRKLITMQQADSSIKRLKYSENYENFSDINIIFECAIENIEVKYQIYRKLEEYCRQLEAMASTTSALAADDLAEGLDKLKDKMVVAHPFNPPHLVPFVEIVKSNATSEKAGKMISDVLESCGRKVVIMKKGAPGFIANRLQHALLREAFYMVEQGYATPRDIDKALMYSFMPRYTTVGLFEHQDAAGLDMVKNIEDYLFPDLSNAKESPDYVSLLCKDGHLGQKTGEGIYKWSKQDKEDFLRRAAEPYWKYFNWNFPDTEI